jgi:uncharacterized membrane protein
MKTLELAQVGIIASLYVAVGLAFQPLSFLAIQIRVASGLIPLIVLYKKPAVYGITLGHFLFNLTSPLGVLDLLSPFFLFFARLLLARFGLKVLPLHIFAVALWVSFLLMLVYGLPFIPTILSVGVGEAIAEIGLGLPLLYAVRRIR